MSKQLQTSVQFPSVEQREVNNMVIMRGWFVGGFKVENKA